MSREAVAAQRFSSDRLVRILDHGKLEDSAYIAMELVEGETLRERLRRGPLPVETAVSIARDVLEGLEKLHGAGMVHRDVKPSNILIGRDGRAKLGDFGLVSRWSEDQSQATRSQAIVGTVEYVSPEQALGEELDGRSDLYALGVVLYEALTGAVVHGNRSSLGTLVAHLTKPAPDIRATRENVPEWLARIVARLLEKNRADRYEDAQGVLRDLDSQSAPHVTAAAPRPSNRRLIAAAVFIPAVFAGLWFANSGVTGRRLGSTTPNVVAAEVKSGVLRALDDKGAVLWTRNFGTPMDDRQFVPEVLAKQPRLRVDDLDGDGQNEVLVVASTTADGLSDLFVIGSDGRDRLRRRPGRPVEYGLRTYTDFTASFPYVLVDKSGRRRFFLLSPNRPDFATILEELDPDGEVIAEYFASGVQTALTRMPFHGRDALVLTGFHNETRGGSLTFLDPENISGRAPGLVKEFQCLSCAQRDPLAIFVVPRSDVVRAIAGPEGTIHTSEAIPLDNGVVSTTAFQASFAGPAGPMEAVVGYRFDPDMTRVLEVLPSNGLSLLHDDLFRSGRLSHRFGARDLKALWNVLTWKDGAWVRVPPGPA